MQKVLDQDATEVISEYWRAIMIALKNGYSANADTGEIFGLKGQRLSTRLAKNQSYPTVRFYVSGMSRPAYSVPVHKVIAYVIFGPAALVPSVEVRHLDGNASNNTKGNLAIGTSSQNQMDKDPSVRSAAAKKARLAQPLESHNAILSEEHAMEILAACDAGRSKFGRVRRGIVKELAHKYGVSPSTVSLVGKRKTWKR